MFDHEAEPFLRWNLRDLGGLPATEGHVVAPGRFFRSGAPSLLQGDDRAALASLRLRTLVDLRTSAELSLIGDASLFAPARSLHVPLFEIVRPHWVAPPDQSPRATAARYLEMLGDGVASVAAVVRKLSEPDIAPVLVYCTAGRDRTGIVVAFLLELLGVPDDVIASDYARSDAAVHDGSRAHAATMVEFLTQLRARHGSVRRLVTDQGVPDSTIEAMQRQLLTLRV